MNSIQYKNQNEILNDLLFFTINYLNYKLHKIYLFKKSINLYKKYKEKL